MSTEFGISEEQCWRADTYNLLANLLYEAPAENLLKTLAELRVEEDASARRSMTGAWRKLSVAARNSDPESVRKEYQRLFIGMTRGEILPYASWYRTGFLMEKPLAQLRNELAALGIERHAQVREPEDHIAALFEVMTLLIRRNDANQSGFFARHIADWTPRLFRDLANAQYAVFYVPVAGLASHFIGLERNLIELSARA